MSLDSEGGQPTLEQVAARAGVGRGTASRVINGSPQVSARTREVVMKAVEELGIGNVTVEKFDVLVVEFARQQGADAIVKGLRAISDYLYETEMAQLNRNEAPDIESVYLIASPQYSFLSSSGIKDMATFGGDISRYVPPRVARRLQEELTRPRTTG